MAYAAVLIVLAAALLVAMHVVAEAVANGAPGWLNLVVLVLAWDAIKIAALVCAVLARRVLSVASRAFRCGCERPYDGSAVVRCG